MNTRIYEAGNRRIWYDRRCRVWTMQILDPEGNQIGDAEHEAVKMLAFRWLRKGGQILHKKGNRRLQWQVRYGHWMGWTVDHEEKRIGKHQFAFSLPQRVKAFKWLQDAPPMWFYEI